MHVTRTVVIAITYGKEGKVNHAHITTGPKMLRPLALGTVRRHSYKPYLLNNTPVEVETEVSIAFLIRQCMQEIVIAAFVRYTARWQRRDRLRSGRITGHL